MPTIEELAVIVAKHDVEITELKGMVKDLTIAIKDLTVAVTRLVALSETYHRPETCPHVRAITQLQTRVDQLSETAILARGGGKVILYVVTAITGVVSSLITLLLRHVIGAK